MFWWKIFLVLFSKLEKTWVIYVQYFDQSNAQQTYEYPDGLKSITFMYGDVNPHQNEN